MELTPQALRALIARGDRARIAHACNVSPSTVSRWANGRLAPAVRYLPNIAAALGLRLTIDFDGPNAGLSRHDWNAAALEVERHEGW